MDRFAYTALSGMRAALQAQDLTAHNIANASTVGFRKDVGIAQARAVSGGSFDNRILAAESNLKAQMSGGEVHSTDRSLDVAMTGNAMLTVEGPDGKEAYSRRGDLKIDNATGVLVNGDGLPVMGSGGPITLPPATRIDIAADGTINIQPVGAGPNETVAVDKLKLITVDPKTFDKGPDGLFRLADGQPANDDPDARLQSGALESSNVNPMASMIEMMEQARTYELQVKMLDQSKDLDTSSAQLMRLDN